MAETFEEIPKIPGFMRAKGWNNGAALMDRWFSGAPNDVPEKGSPSTNLLKMDSWVLTFPRAKEVYDSMMREQIWKNPAALQALRNVLRRKGLLSPKASTFGNLRLPATMVHDEQINFRVVGTGTHVYLDPLDDMYAALGRFAIYCAVSGRVAPMCMKPGPNGRERIALNIESVGFYVRDSYDFNGDQFLGYWNFDSGDAGKLPWFGSSEVTNESFRTWRTKYKRGGDFYVFSDIKIVKLSKPDTVILDA